MSLHVALETSSHESSVAVAKDGECRRASLSGRAHASDLLPSLQRLLAELKAEASSVEAVMVGTGPGSYTGLRVGLATAHGLALGSGAVVRGVPSGETLAFAQLETGQEAVYLLDARQGELYVARYARTREDVMVALEPCVASAGELQELLPAEGPIFSTKGIVEAAGLTDSQAARLRLDVVPDALALLRLGALRLAQHGPQTAKELEPLYLRPFAAKLRKR